MLQIKLAPVVVDGIRFNRSCEVRVNTNTRALDAVIRGRGVGHDKGYSLKVVRPRFVNCADSTVNAVLIGLALAQCDETDQAAHDVRAALISFIAGSQLEPCDDSEDVLALVDMAG